MWNISTLQIVREFIDGGSIGGLLNAYRSFIDAIPARELMLQ
jgi:hypothetical protein